MLIEVTFPGSELCQLHVFADDTEPARWARLTSLGCDATPEWPAAAAGQGRRTSVGRWSATKHY